MRDYNFPKVDTLVPLVCISIVGKKHSKMRKSYISILLIFSTFLAFSVAKAQSLNTLSFKQLQQYEDSLIVLGKTVLTDTIQENRQSSAQLLAKTLESALKVQNSFAYPFDSLRSVSISYPSDSTFRIFTWQLYIDINEYRYFGAIQMNSEELKLFPLNDRSEEMEEIAYEDFTADYWYGSLYYNIEAFDTPEGPQYLLFGFDAYQFFTKRKLIDVLSFKDGQPSFGAPVFKEQEGEGIGIDKNRLVFEYTAEAAIRVNYDPNLKMIVHDHLISMMTPRGPVMAPDGSYVGYQLQAGTWNIVEKIFHQVSDEAPRPKPILNQTERSKRKDIFGNK